MTPDEIAGERKTRRFTIPSQQPGSDLISFADLIDLLRANLRALLGLPFVFGVLSLFYALSQPPIYQATALLQLDPRPARPLAKSDDLYDPGYESNRYYGTQLRILESRKLAAMLTDRLNLVDVAEFGGEGTRPPPLWERILALIPGTPPAPEPEIIPREEQRELAIEAVEKATISTLGRNSTLFYVQFQSRDPELAAQAANALADLYIEELLQSRLDVYAKANTWLNAKLGSVQGELNTAEQALQNFRDERKIVRVGGNRDLLEKELLDVTNRLRVAENERQAAENIFREILRLSQNSSSITAAQSLLLDANTKDTASALLEATSNVRQLEQRYGNRHPQYLSALARQESLEKSLQDQLERKKNGVEAQLKSARALENQLRQEKARSENKLRELDTEEFRLNMLERDVSSNRQLYDLFLARLQETESTSSFSEADARIADPAVPPRSVFSPQPKRYAILGAAAGFVIALMLVLLRELLRARIETPEDMERISTVPFLGVAPHVQIRNFSQKVRERLTQDARSPYADAIRSLKTGVIIGTNPGDNTGKRCLAITSTEPGEGKTTLTTSLACVFAPSQRTLIVDADMRRPQIARTFGARSSRKAGLAEYLQGQMTIEEIIQHDDVTGVHYICAGNPPPNPALLLESKAFAELMARLRDEFATIVVDTPPLLATSDALHLIPNIDGILLVARAHKTHRKAFNGALKILESAGANCAGLILNDTRVHRGGYGGSYYYAHGYRY